MTEAVIRFGSGDAEYLILTLHSRSLPHAADYWDGNWLACTVEVAAGAFRGSMNALIRNEDIERFHSRVAQLNERLTGEALFDTLEGWFDLRLIGDGRGHIEARGQLCDDPVHGNVLEFRLFFDQTYLQPLMGQLLAAMEAFLVVGRPDAEPDRRALRSYNVHGSPPPAGVRGRSAAEAQRMEGVGFLPGVDDDSEWRTFDGGRMEDEFLARVAIAFPDFAVRLGDGSAVGLENVQPPATDTDLRKMEDAVGMPLPESYKRLLRCGREFWLLGGAVQFGIGHPFVHDFEPLDKLTPQQRRVVQQKGGSWPPPSQGMVCFAEFFMEADGDQVLFDVAGGMAGGEYPVMYYAHESRPPSVRRLSGTFPEFLAAFLDYPAFAREE